MQNIVKNLLDIENNIKVHLNKFNITNHISNIVRHDSLNIDLGLTTTSNIEDISLKNGYFNNLNRLNLPSPSITLPFPVALFGSNPAESDLSKRLKLEVIYTEY